MAFPSDAKVDVSRSRDKRKYRGTASFRRAAGDNTAAAAFSVSERDRSET
jgi:hypothetical protein